MKYKLFALLFFVSSGLSAQEEVNIYSERQSDVVTIYADNPSVIPMTIELNLKMTNMESDFGGKNGTFVIPNGSKKYKVAAAQTIRERGKSGLSLESFIYIGDVNKEHDDTHVYELPFESGQTYLVFQGYNGKFSHQGENALDFGMDIGEKVYAARGGTVYRVVDKHTKSCKKSSCQKFNNYITIYHTDGTFSEYSHLKKNGAEVKIGDVIETGDFLGYSGNTGWSSGPHLHFVVYKYNKKGERITLKTKFRTEGNDAVYLKEKSNYSKP